jgi:predicted AlkP superfamily phosphohydrolase/phosphomutase
MPSGPRMLALGMDAAEPQFVLDLMERGELPTLRRLLDEGTWASLHSPAHIGSEAVYPTFFTGAQPQRHGIYGGWSWRPDAMSVVPMRPVGLRPFWGSLADDGMTLGVLDVPLAPHLGLRRGFELTEWGAHMTVDGRTTISPREVVSAVDRDHPFTLRQAEPAERAHVEPAALASACVEGAALKGELAARLLERARPDLAIVVFGEVHRASHDLWHTAEPENPLYDDLPADRSDGAPGLVDVFREVDRQIGRLIDSAGEEAAVVVFSLQGMRPSRGIAANVLGPVLRELGFTQPARRGGRSALAAVKRRTPSALKRLYHQRVPRDTRYRLAAPTMLPALDWSQTRAFALPTDQHGWVRVNLRGREADGAVDPEDYESTCEELREALESLCTEDGRQIVRDVIRADPGGPPPALLPDLVVHWSDAALESPLRVREPAIEAWPIVPRRTGQHRPDGFCLSRGLDRTSGDSIDGSDLHRLLRP